MFKKLIFLSLSAFLNGHELFAQTDIPAIQLDRPDLTESPFLTPKNYFQFESGLLLKKNENGTYLYNTPTVLSKYGVSETFELRLITELSTVGRINEQSFTGLPPVWVGFKSKLLHEKGWVPEMAFISHLALPSFASDKFKSKYIAPQFRFAMQHTLSDKISLGYNIGIEWDGLTIKGKRLYSVSTGIALTEKFGMFLEIYGNGNSIRKSNHAFDAGFTYLISQNSMLDFSSGFNLTNLFSTYFISCGYSFRFNSRGFD